MFFDRNEIHIQALVVFSNGKCSIFNPHLRKIIFKIYTQKTQENPTNKQQKTRNNRKQHRQNLVPRTYRFRKFSKFCEVQIGKNNIFPG